MDVCVYVSECIYELMYSGPETINSLNLPDLENQGFPGDARAINDILFQLSSNYSRFRSSTYLRYNSKQWKP